MASNVTISKEVFDFLTKLEKNKYNEEHKKLVKDLQILTVEKDSLATSVKKLLKVFLILC